MRLLDIVRESAGTLEGHGVEDALADSELIVCHAAGTDRMTLFIENPEADTSIRKKIRRLISRRASGEPLQYILGSVGFIDLTITVGNGVLIPRPETELLAQKAISFLGLPSTKANPRILDLCTGSGCIALALARARPDASVIGADISPLALRFARRNAALNGIRNIRFLKGSLFAPIGKKDRFDLIVSNPPYIRTADIQGLQREIRDWEPLDALDGGEDGLDFYRQIFEGAADRLNSGGMVMVEIGYDQGKDVAEIAEKNGFRGVLVEKDYAGLDRIVTASA